jgi:hypothetical protein
MNFDTLTKLIKTDQALPGGKPANATEPGDDIVAAGAISIAEIEKLMEELRTARDYLKAEGERVRRMNARYVHLTSTASASVKIIAESMANGATTEIEAATEADLGCAGAMSQSCARVHDGKLQHEYDRDPNTATASQTASKNPCDKAERANRMGGPRRPCAALPPSRRTDLCPETK